MKKPGKYNSTGIGPIKYLVAFHTKLEDRYTALKEKSVVMQEKQIKHVKYEKLKIRSISSEQFPCMENESYEANYCLNNQES